ncbi:MAG TPA: carboxypeptidase regulatory-like domain-containing protein [Bryobacteraceae bacterium]|jgi:protocatechuate 3,4-dioxygenase beta subunit|nr:carboxypeptidase regulatory-like domain-containing protein [Bryobacteraceae bacterium]
MKDIEPGKYDLSAQRPGFGNGAYGPTLSLDAGQRLSGIIVRLTPNAVVTGRILDEDGEPLAGVNVSSWRYAQGSRKKELWPGDGGDKTNDLSEYRLYGLSPGRYYIQATRPLPWMEAQSQGRSAGKAPEAFAPTYYPGTTDVNKAVAVELKAGAQIHGIDFAFFRIHAVHVRGRMQYPADAGRRPVMLALAPRGSGVYARWTLRRRADIDDPDGKFELTNIVPGSYSLSAIMMDGNHDITAHQRLDVGSNDIDNLVLTLEAGDSLPGCLVFEGPPPTNLAQIEVGLRDANGNGMHFGPASGKAKEDGSFTLGNVGADSYEVVVGGLPEGYYVESVRMGDAEVKESGIDATHDAGGPLVITVSAGAGQIEGVARDAKQQPAPGATVLLVPAYKDVTTDQYGRFVLKSIEPGDYKLFAWEQEPEDYMDPEVLKPAEDRALSVHIREAAGSAPS